MSEFGDSRILFSEDGVYPPETPMLGLGGQDYIRDSDDLWTNGLFGLSGPGPVYLKAQPMTPITDTTHRTIYNVPILQKSSRSAFDHIVSDTIITADNEKSSRYASMSRSKLPFQVVDPLSDKLSSTRTLPSNLSFPKPGQIQITDNAISEILKIKHELEAFDGDNTDKFKIDGTKYGIVTGVEYGKPCSSFQGLDQHSYVHANSPGASSGYLSSSQVTPSHDLSSPPLSSRRGSGYSGDERTSSSETLYTVVPRSDGYVYHADGSIVNLQSSDTYIVEGNYIEHTDDVITTAVYEPVGEASSVQYEQHFYHDSVASYPTSYHHHTPRHTSSSPVLSDHQSVSSTEPQIYYGHETAVSPADYHNPHETIPTAQPIRPSSEAIPVATIHAKPQAPAKKPRRKRRMSTVEAQASSSADAVIKKRKERRKETNRKASQNYRERQTTAKNNKLELRNEAAQVHETLNLANIKLGVRIEMLVRQFADAVTSAQ